MFNSRRKQKDNRATLKYTSQKVDFKSQGIKL
jgi:hypothetical protein